jgi:hypothetical protein
MRRRSSRCFWGSHRETCDIMSVRRVLPRANKPNAVCADSEEWMNRSGGGAYLREPLAIGRVPDGGEQRIRRDLRDAVGVRAEQCRAAAKRGVRRDHDTVAPNNGDREPLRERR